MNLDGARTVRELAIEIPNATRTFEKLGIDYCCGGCKITERCLPACACPAGDVLRELEQGGNFKPGPDPAAGFRKRNAG